MYINSASKVHKDFCIDDPQYKLTNLNWYLITDKSSNYIE